MAKSYTNTQIESELRSLVAHEAERNGLSFSAQVKAYRDRCIALEGEVQELRTQIQEMENR